MKKFSEVQKDIQKDKDQMREKALKTEQRPMTQKEKDRFIEHCRDMKKFLESKGLGRESVAQRKAKESGEVDWLDKCEKCGESLHLEKNVGRFKLCTTCVP